MVKKTFGVGRGSLAWGRGERLPDEYWPCTQAEFGPEALCTVCLTSQLHTIRKLSGISIRF